MLRWTYVGIRKTILFKGGPVHAAPQWGFPSLSLRLISYWSLFLIKISLLSSRMYNSKSSIPHAKMAKENVQMSLEYLFLEGSLTQARELQCYQRENWDGQIQIWKSRERKEVREKQGDEEEWEKGSSVSLPVWQDTTEATGGGVDIWPWRWCWHLTLEVVWHQNRRITASHSCLLQAQYLHFWKFVFRSFN